MDALRSHSTKAPPWAGELAAFGLVGRPRPVRGLIMCHPGGGARPSAEVGKRLEYDFLMSARFPELLAAHDVTVDATESGRPPV